jgi:signal transduction histidine kinase
MSNGREVRRWLGGVPLVDVVLGVCLVAVGLADALTQDEYDAGRERLVVAVLLQTLPLVWRRSQTLPVVLLSMLGLTVEVAGQEPYSGLYGLVGFLLLVHATARWASGAAQRYAVAALLAGVAIRTLSEQSEGPLGWVGGVLMPLALGAVVWAVGTLGRAGEERERQLVVEAGEKQAVWQARSVAAVEAERARISRELHDVVGHALAGISLTAGAAEQQPGSRDPEMATALALIRTVSRDAASDVRRLVALLREDDEVHSTEPPPTLAQVPALVDRAREAGLVVDLVVTGEPLPISGGVHLAAYRMVQEGLTNVARHAGSASTTIRVRWLPGRLEVAVENAAPHARPAEPEGGGLGLVGLRERINVFGGGLDAAPLPSGGFLLDAWFPLS